MADERAGEAAPAIGPRRRVAFLGRYARPQRRHLVALVGLAFLPALLAVVEPLPLKLLIDNALRGEPVTGLPADLLDVLGVGDGTERLVVVAAALAFCATLAAYLLTDIVGLYWEWVGARMVRDASRDAFDALQRLPLAYHDAHPSGDSLSRVNADASAVYTAVSALFVSPVLHLVTICLIGVSAWHLDRGLTVLIVLLAPVTAFASRRLSAVLKRQATRARTQRVALVSFVTDVVRSLPLVQASTAERQNVSTFRSLGDRARVGARRVTLLESAGGAVGSVVGAIGLAVVTVVGGRGVIRGTLTLGDLVVFLAYARVLDAQFRGLLAIGRQLRLADVGLERLDELQDARLRLPEPPVALPLGDPDQGVSLELVGVSFGYTDDRNVLDDVTLRIAPGETVAVVGPTGAGKSTLAGLVSRLYDPQQGSVRMNGIDLRDLELSTVRGAVAVLRQDPLLLPVSVADNIALGRAGAGRDEIEAAAKAAMAHEFIAALPDGYDTVLAGSEVPLSGGERQRLALARALLKDAPILVLDEPTSSLDVESEAAIVVALQNEAKPRTLLVIAHRLATTRHADRVVVLDDGRLVEVGTHEELAAGDGLYARFTDLLVLDGGAS